MLRFSCVNTKISEIDVVSFVSKIAIIFSDAAVYGFLPLCFMFISDYTVSICFTKKEGLALSVFNGAEDEARTRNNLLGRQGLYH